MQAKKLTSRREFIRLGTIGAASAVILVACAQAPAAPTEVPKAAAPTQAPAAATPTQAPAAAKPTVAATPAAQPKPASKEQVVLRYAGLTSMGESLIKWTKDWLDAKNYKVELSAYDQQSLPEKIVQAAATRTYIADMIQIGPNESIGLKAAGYVKEVPTDVLKTVSWDEVAPIFRRLLGYKGKIYALPYDGDAHSAAFRGDVFADADNQAKFKAKYGYAMDAELGPKDWVEYRNYAEFFTGSDWNKTGKKDGFGFAHMTKRNDTLFWGFFSRAAAYAKHPDNPSFFFDVKTMKPRINNPAFVRAVKEWKEECDKWSPPGGGTQLGWGNVIEAYTGNRAAMCIGWGDHGTNSQNPETSIIKGKSRYSMTPGSKEVYNDSSGKFESMQAVSYAPFIAYGGWSLSIPRDSKNPEAAFDWGGYCASLDISNKMVPAWTGANPIRNSQFTDVKIYTGNTDAKWDEKEALSYMKSIKDTISHPNAVADLRILGFFEYVHPLEEAVATVMAGQADPQKALDQCATAWDTITKKFGVDTQRELYADAIGAV